MYLFRTRQPLDLKSFIPLPQQYQLFTVLPCVELEDTNRKRRGSTPQLFLHTRRLPVSPDVNISDIRKITFLSAIDSLLTVVRCNDPTHVFTMHEINRQWWFRSSHRCQIVRTSSTGGLIGHRRAPKLLRKRGKATLSTLIAEFKTRATSWGIFPLSLLDAAAYQLILRRWSKGHMAFNLASLWDRTLQYAIPDIQLQPPQ